MPGRNTKLGMSDDMDVGLKLKGFLSVLSEWSSSDGRQSIKIASPRITDIIKSAINNGGARESKIYTAHRRMIAKIDKLITDKEAYIIEQAG